EQFIHSVDRHREDLCNRFDLEVDDIFQGDDDLYFWREIRMGAGEEQTKLVVVEGFGGGRGIAGRRCFFLKKGRESFAFFDLVEGLVSANGEDPAGGVGGQPILSPGYEGGGEG